MIRVMNFTRSKNFIFKKIIFYLIIRVINFIGIKINIIKKKKKGIALPFLVIDYFEA